MANVNQIFPRVNQMSFMTLMRNNAQVVTLPASRASDPQTMFAMVAQQDITLKSRLAHVNCFLHAKPDSI